LIDRSADAKSARRSWKGATNERKGLKQALSGMAAGIERCMYCGDSRGTDIDHFEPIAKAPFRTFEWHNHTLACTSCNSNEKRDSYPCAEDGSPLLINPTAEEPSDHLDLLLSVGEYEGITIKGSATIRVFQLNRKDLAIGRANAFIRCKSMLRDYIMLESKGRTEEAVATQLALKQLPFVDVLFAMYRTIDLPGAATVLGGPEILRLLTRWHSEDTQNNDSD